MAEKSISYGIGLSDQMINQMLQSNDPSIVAQAQDYINQAQAQQEQKPNLLQRIGNFFISPAASAEVVMNPQGNLVDTEGNINFFNTGTEQVFPRQGLESLYPNFSAGPGFNTFLRPTTNMATGISPLLKDDEETGLFAEGLTGEKDDENQNLIGLFDEGLTGKKNDEEENLTGLFDEGLTTGMPSFGSTQKAPTAFGTKRRGGGISDLFRALIGFAVPGSSFFTGGLDGIRSLNQRLQGSTFGRSRSMQEFLERKRNEKLGNFGPGGIGLSRSELVQRNFANRVRDLADAGDDDRGGGGGASRTQRDAGPGFDDVSEAGSF